MPLLPEPGIPARRRRRRGESTLYTFGFAAAVCGVCSIFVSGAAVALKDRQDANKVLDRQKKVLTVAGLMEEGEKLESDEISKRFTTSIEAQLVDLDEGKRVPDADIQGKTGVELAAYDQRKFAKDPKYSTKAPDNAAKVSRLPEYALVYRVKASDSRPAQIILPIEGMGLWGTLYGFISLSEDVNTVQGIVFYEHIETPGLGAEVDNPSWKAKWEGKKVREEGDAIGEVDLRVVKGMARSDDEHGVDGLSGATLTSNGVSNTLDFWLGDDAFGPYLSNLSNGSAG